MATRGAALEPPLPTISVDSDRFLWITAVAFFGVGDFVTTAVGLQFDRITEVGPVAAFLYYEFGLLPILGLKLAAFAACYCIWRLFPRPYNIGAPLAFAIVGFFATAWNLAVITVVVA